MRVVLTLVLVLSAALVGQCAATPSRSQDREVVRAAIVRAAELYCPDLQLFAQLKLRGRKDGDAVRVEIQVAEKGVKPSVGRIRVYADGSYKVIDGRLPPQPTDANRRADSVKELLRDHYTEDFSKGLKVRFSTFAIWFSTGSEWHGFHRDIWGFWAPLLKA